MAHNHYSARYSEEFIISDMAILLVLAYGCGVLPGALAFMCA